MDVPSLFYPKFLSTKIDPSKEGCDFLTWFLGVCDE